MIRGHIYNLESKKDRFIRCAGLFGYLPYEIPTFQPPHPSPLIATSLYYKPSLLKGIFFAKLLVN